MNAWMTVHIYTMAFFQVELSCMGTVTAAKQCTPDQIFLLSTLCMFFQEISNIFFCFEIMFCKEFVYI